MSLWQVSISAGVAFRLRIRRNNSSISLTSSPWAETSRVSSLAGSASASARVGPLTRAMIGPSCIPLDRSHSQALSLAGRPKVVRKPLGSSTPESGRAAARVPGATPGIFETEPVTRYTASSRTSAGSRRAIACE